MSFRMRGAALDQGCRTARYTATWVLIVSMTSSSIVLGAPNRREARRAKKNCCPAPTCCTPVTSCNACNSCEHGAVVAPAAEAAPAETKPAAPAPGPAPDKPPPDPKPPAEGNTGVKLPKSYSPLASDIGYTSPNKMPNPQPRAEEPKPEPTRESGISEAAPIVISDDPPPAPKANEFKSNVTAERDPFADPETPPAIEPPKPASGGGNYQEYIERYFNRKNDAPAVPKEEPVAPEVNRTPEPSHDEPPALTPPKPAKEYNDPFRPTSYRSSQERTWRDSTGASRMKARFLGVDEQGFALMHREDGKRTRVPLANLSASDQRFIELLAIRDTNVHTQNIASRPRGK